MNRAHSNKKKGLAMIEARLGLVIPPDDPMASAAAELELSLERMWAAKEVQWAEEDRLTALREKAPSAPSASTTAGSPASTSMPVGTKSASE